MHSCNVTYLKVSFGCIKNSCFCSTLLNFPHVMKISNPMIYKTEKPGFLLCLGSSWSSHVFSLEFNTGEIPSCWLFLWIRKMSPLPALTREDDSCGTR